MTAGRGESLEARRMAVGLSRRDLAAAAGLPLDVVARLERNEPVAPQRFDAVVAALTAAEVRDKRDRHFPGLVVAAAPGPRTQPWPMSPTRCLLDFRSEGAAAGVDIVVVTGAGGLHVLLASSPLGHRILGAATGCGIPVDGVTCFVVVAATVDDALEAALLSGQVERALRAPMPPLRVLHRHEPGIVGVRDGQGRIALGVAEEPVDVPAAPAAATTPATRPRRRSSREAQAIA